MEHIAIKPGSTYTSIYVHGHGLVLREPSLISFDGRDRKNLRAVGYDAAALRENAPDVTTVSPISDGIITEPEIFSVMLKAFIDKICPDEAIIRPRYDAIVGIPLGLTMDEREMYEDAVIEAGVNSVTLVPNIVLSAIGADLPVGTGKGMVAVNIGGGRTEMAVISCGGIINGCGVSIGGSTMDRAIAEFVASSCNMRISLDEARKVREEIGTLYENDIATMTINGQDVTSRIPEVASVRAFDIRDVIMPYYIRICELVRTLIGSCPASLAREISGSEIAITGGASNIPGIDKLFMQQLSVNARAFDRPEYLQMTGAGRLLSDDELMKQLLSGGSV